MPSTATPLWARATSSVTTARPPISHSGSSGAHCTVIAFIAPPPSLGQRSLIRRSLTQPLQDEGHVHLDRTSVVSGKSGSVRVDLGGRRIIKKKKNIIINHIVMYIIPN